MPPQPAIIFDFDGVIVDSEPMHEAAIRAAVRELGLDFSPHDYRTKYLGFDDRDIYAAVAKAAGRVLSGPDIARLADLKWTHAQAAIAKGLAPPLPGSVELLKAAAAAGPVAICSGARRCEVDLVLTTLGVRGLLGIVVTADDVAKSKPDPEPYRLTTRRLGIAPSSCVAIEDTDKGVRSALDAGVRVVAVCHSMTRAELAAADRVVASTAELTVGDLLSMVKGRPPRS